LGFGFRGRDSVWSIASGVGMLLLCFWLVWQGFPALVSSLPSFSAPHVTVA
jgi:hypothetical protein